MTDSTYGLSGLALYLPRLRVELRQWASWTGHDWPRLQARVGDSYRLPGPDESIYTMAAGAVLRLLLAYDLDPRQVGLLALATESATDGSAGAIIVHGMVDAALRRLGRPPLARDCEVPEYKHACLGGVYAMKGALRYLATDGQGRLAIVVCSDVAVYPRGSSGEETQGSGAVALLLTEHPTLAEVDLAHAGSAACYRGPDFRKPVRRQAAAEPQQVHGWRRGAHDFPVFNGRYTTVCYIDELLRAVEALLARTGRSPRALYHEVDGVFLHRPYRQMPLNALAALYVWGLHGAPEHRQELAGYCAAAGADLDRVLAETASRPDLFAAFAAGDAEAAVYPEAMKVTRHFRSTAKFREVLAHKMRLGQEGAARLGNLYAGALFGWLAAGFAEAAASGVELTGQSWLTLGYGSGDAAEAMLLRVAPGWAEAAARIDFAGALAGAVDLAREQYEALHDGRPVAPTLPAALPGSFVISGSGSRDGRDGGPQDLAVDQYRFLEAPAAPPAHTQPRTAPVGNPCHGG